MILRAKHIDLSTGNILVAVLSQEDATKLAEAQAQETAAHFARNMKKPSKPRTYGN